MLQRVLGLGKVRSSRSQVIVQGHKLQHVAKVVGATSSEGFSRLGPRPGKLDYIIDDDNRGLFSLLSRI